MNTATADHDLFLTLLEANQRPLHKVCWVYGNTSHDRDDLLQEIIQQLWMAFPRYDRARPFSTWMFRVALNVAIDFRRRRQRQQVRETVSLNDTDISIPDIGPDDASRLEQLRDLRELLEQQPEANRALMLLYLEGYSHRKIGEILGISESNAGTRLNRLKQSLRHTLQDPSTLKERV